MAQFVQLVIIAAIAATTCGQINQGSSSSRDYYLISQRELLHDVEAVQMQVDSVNARLADRLDVIEQQQQQLLQEIVQLNKTLMPLQALSLVRKQCIQKFDSQLVTYEDAELQMKYCYKKASTILPNLTKPAQTNVRAAESEVLYTMAVNVASCDKATTKNDTLLQECYVKYVNSATFNVNQYLKTARAQLNQNLFDSSIASNTAVECSFVEENQTLQTMGRTIQSIDECEAALNKNRDIAVLSSTAPKNVQNLITSTLTKH